MDSEGVERRLAAILSTDAVGYSRLMAADEVATVRTVTAHRAELSRQVEAHRGRVVDAPGDNLLAEFASPTEAVRCALAAQARLAEANAALPEAQRMRFRIGIHIGEVLVEGERIYGDGVNVAARLEALAEPGGVLVSDEVYRQVSGKLEARFEDLGEREVKNIPRPVRVHRVVTGTESAAPSAPPTTRRSSRPLVALALLLLVGAGLWQVARESDLWSDGDDAALLALPRGPGIAVLPFVDQSADPAQAYFADGLSEAIVTRLARFSQLQVIGLGATRRYRDSALDAQTIGRELDARYVLTGSVRRAGDQVRVTAELIDITTSLQVWGEAYDRALSATNLFEIQDRLSERVVATVADAYGILARSGLDEGRASPPESLDAYECVLRAHAYNAIHTEAAHGEALRCLERAVEVDPGYAEAWAQLAYLHREAHHHGFNPKPDSIDAALAAARRAVALDPTDQLGQLALSLALFNRGDRDGFYVAAERALALNPNETRVLASVGLNMTYLDDTERGVALTRKAMALRPFHPGWFYLAPFHHHYRRGEYEAALEAAQKIGTPELWDGYAALAQAYGQLERREEAGVAVNGLLGVYPDFAANAYAEFRKRQIPGAEIEHLMEGLRKAGLAIAPAG